MRVLLVVMGGENILVVAELLLGELSRGVLDGLPVGAGRHRQNDAEGFLALLAS
jgi:hypothetical protein